MDRCAGLLPVCVYQLPDVEVAELTSLVVVMSLVPIDGITALYVLGAHNVLEEFFVGLLSPSVSILPVVFQAVLKVKCHPFGEF